MSDRNYINFAAYWICVAGAERAFEQSDGGSDDRVEMFRRIDKARKIAEDRDKSIGIVMNWVRNHKIKDYEALE